MNIIENPVSKELFAEGQESIYAFDGTPYAKYPAAIAAWNVVGQAPTVDAWIAEPGNSNTLYGAMIVFTIDNSGRKTSFRMGDNIAYLLNWVKDAQANFEAISYQWLGAYSDRNVARSKANPSQQ